MCGKNEHSFSTLPGMPGVRSNKIHNNDITTIVQTYNHDFTSETFEKRYLLDDGITSIPYGHYSITDKKILIF